MDKYKVLSEFKCGGKQMVTVRVGDSVHVMDQDDWKLVYDRRFKDWKKKKSLGSCFYWNPVLNLF